MESSESSVVDDNFSAFESGVSEEYASAESSNVESCGGVEEGAVADNAEGGAMTIMTTSSSRDDDDDDEFFDAFVDSADGLKSTEEGDGGSSEPAADATGEAGEDYIGEPSVQPEEMDLFNVGEPANTAQPTEEDETKPTVTDLFSAFDDINEAQGDNDNIVANEIIAPQEADLFGDFGVAETSTETESPAAILTVDPSVITEPSLDVPENSVGEVVGDGVVEHCLVPNTYNVDSQENIPTLNAGDFDGIPLTQSEPGKESDTMGEGENGESADVLSDFDALGVQEDAPLPSLDSFASNANEENKPEAQEEDSEPATLNGFHTNDDDNDDAKDTGQDITDEDTKPTTETNLTGGEPENESNVAMGVSEEDDDKQTELDKAEEDGEGIISSTDNGEPAQTELKNGSAAMSDDENFGGFELPDDEGNKPGEDFFETASISEDENKVGTLPSLENGKEIVLESAFGDIDDVVEPKKDDENNGIDIVPLENNAESTSISEDDAFGDENFGGFSSFEDGASEQHDVVGESTAVNEATLVQDDEHLGGFSSSFEGSPPESNPPSNNNEVEAPLAVISGPTTSDEVKEDVFGIISNNSDNDFIEGFASTGEVSTERKNETPLKQDEEDFGGFSSFEEGTPANNPPDEEKEALPVSQDSASYEVNADEEPSDEDGISIDDTPKENLESTAAIELNNGDEDFGGFSSFEEGEGLTVQDETDANEAPDAEIIEDNGDDFGGFSSFDESPPAADQPPVGTSLAAEDDEAFSETFDTTTSPDAALDKDVPANQHPATVADDDDGFGQFGDFNAFEEAPAPLDESAVPAVEEEVASLARQTPTTDNDDEFGDFGDFKAPEDSGASLGSGQQDEAPPATVVSSADEDDEFGDFGGVDAFDESAPAGTSDQHAPTNDVEEEVKGNQMKASSAEEEVPSTELNEPLPQLPTTDDGNDEFGDFGDFEAFEESPPEDSAMAETGQHAHTTEEEAPASQAVNSANDGDDDDFGEFGDFDAFEEAPNEASSEEFGAPTESVEDGTEADNEQPAQIAAEKEEAPVSQAVSSADGGDDDQFGDFGDFEAFEEPPNEVTTPEAADAQAESDPKITPTETESAPRPVLAILNENIRLMFQDVFESDTRVAPDSEDKETCSELPFDIPMCNILPEQALPKENDTVPHSRQSEEELAKMKKYFEDLPRSPPLTILSDEKWYPYSQYEFHRDGSPYADSVERVAAPAVPEVLSIDLPTGFEASHLSSSPSNPSTPPPSSAYRNAPTVVDFPSTPKGKNERNENNDVQEETEVSDEMDFSQLSATGKRFMEQLPDLSYMLKSTLSLPNEKQ